MTEPKKPATLTREMIAAQRTTKRQPYIKSYQVCHPDPASGEDRITVFCRDMDSTDYTYRRLLDSRYDKSGKRIDWRFEHHNELVAVHSISDETGEPLYSEADLKSDWWEGLFAGYKADLIAVALEHNGLSVGFTRVDEKNSEEGTSAGVPNSLPPDSDTAP